MPHGPFYRHQQGDTIHEADVNDLQVALENTHTVAEVDSALAAKADTTALTAGLATKAEQTTALEFDTRITALETATAPRLHGIIGRMATPPTVTIGAANAASVIAGSTRTAPDNAAFTYVGTRRGFGAVYPNDMAYSPAFIADPTGAKALYVAGNWGVEFTYTGAQLELIMLGKGARFRLTVVGEGYVSRLGTTLPADGNFYNVLYDFGTAKTRTLRWDFAPTVAFVGTYTNTGATTIGLTTRSLGPKVVILGDSFTEGTGADAFGLTGYWDRMGQYLGWPDIAASGWGGTGYLATNGGTATTFRTRLVKDVIDAAPEIVVVAGGINDHGIASAAAINAEADLLYAAIASGLPSSRVITIGPFWPNGRPIATVIQTRDAIRTAAQDAIARLFADPIGGTVPYTGTIIDYYDTGFLTGTGKATAPAHDGNADFYTSSDGTHPTQAGHDYLALRLAETIASNSPELIG